MLRLLQLVGRSGIGLVLRSGIVADLLDQLDSHKLDLVLANHPAPPDAEAMFDSTLVAEQPVSLVARPPKPKRRFKFPKDLNETPLLLPGRGSAIRSTFDALLGRASIRPTVLAEVDDMAMLRVMARECDGLTLVPPIVVVDELQSGILIERCRLRDIREQFYAITQQRRFPSPLVSELVRPTVRVQSRA